MTRPLKIKNFLIEWEDSVRAEQWTCAVAIVHVNQAVDPVQRNNRCLFGEACEIRRHALWAERRISER